MTEENYKHRQHYVWKHYLEGWAPQGKLFCLRKDQVFPVSPNNIAHERDFYRLRELTAEDVQTIKRIIDISNQPWLRRLNHNWLNAFDALFRMRKYLQERVRRPNPELERKLDIAINNLEENLQMGIEHNAIPHLAALREKRTAWLEQAEEFATFLHFLLVQQFRGPGMRQRITQAFRLAHSAVNGKGASASEGSSDSEQTHGPLEDSAVLCHVFAANVGASLFKSRHRHRISLLRTENTEFITADQSVINTRAVSTLGVAPPTEVELYYPISPRLALLITADDRRPGRFRQLLTDAEVVAYNNMIAEVAYEQIYATNEEMAKMYKGVAFSARERWEKKASASPGSSSAT
jgi:hypothetical protein